MAIVGARSIAEAAATAAGAALVSAWANREAAADGDRMVLTSTGASFVYSSTIGEWVRPWVYAGTPILRGRIDGDVVPASETPAWTDATTGDASIASDGTIVTWSGGTSGSNTGFSDLATGGSDDQNHFWTGRFEATSIPTTGGAWASFGRIWYIYTGSVAVGLTVNKVTADDVALMTWTGPAEVGTSYSTEVATTECYLELFVIGTYVWLYHDHAAQPMATALVSAFPTTTDAPKYRLGDSSSSGMGAQTAREMLVGEF